MIDANGLDHPASDMPKYVKNVSVLVDTSHSLISRDVTHPVVLGLETIEYENIDDSLAFAYLCGYIEKEDTVGILKRFAVDLRPFRPNIHASIKPIVARRSSAGVLLYATINMSAPKTGPTAQDPPYLRGLVQFNTHKFGANYPMFDIGDDEESRVMLATSVNICQPSISLLAGVKNGLLLPSFPEANLQEQISSNVISTSTDSDTPYFFGFDLTDIQIKEENSTL